MGEKYDFNDKETAKEYVNLFIDDTLNTPAKVIDWLLSEGIITDEQSELLKEAFISYTDKEEKQIEALVATGLTREEAIEKLKNSGKIADGSSTLDTESHSTISDTDAQIYASQLHDAMKGGIFGGLGTDDEQFASIMNNDNLTADDWVKIISEYNKKDSSSFIQDVNADFSGETQDKYQAKIAEVLLEAAENGNSEAIDLLCKEMHNATGGMSGTADEFIDAILKSGKDDIIAKIARRYKEQTNTDIFKDIKGDFSFGTEDEYLEIINNAIADNPE